jgi:hypothetical protein
MKTIYFGTWNKYYMIRYWLYYIWLYYIWLDSNGSDLYVQSKTFGHQDTQRRSNRRRLRLPRLLFGAMALGNHRIFSHMMSYETLKIHVPRCGYGSNTIPKVSFCKFEACPFQVKLYGTSALDVCMMFVTSVRSNQRPTDRWIAHTDPQMFAPPTMYAAEVTQSMWVMQIEYHLDCKGSSPFWNKWLREIKCNSSAQMSVHESQMGPRSRLIQTGLSK